MPAPAWSSVHWFQWDTLRAFAWGQPLFLYGIAAVPLLFLVRWLLVVQYRQKLAVASRRAACTGHRWACCASCPTC
jgi:Ca-activated chloride channel family protein